jgi:hypothetical protein
MPEAATETGIAEKFAPLRRDVSANAPEAKTPILKPFTATLPWHSQRGENAMLSLSVCRCGRKCFWLPLLLVS